MLIPSILKAYASEFDEQLRQPEDGSSVWPIPKLVDFDMSTAQFVLDEHQPLKTPEWTYQEPEDLAEAVGVRLAPDVALALQKQADKSDSPLDATVNEALREWLKTTQGR